MAAKLLTLLLCCTPFIQIIGAEDDVILINVPPEIDQRSIDVEDSVTFSTSTEFTTAEIDSNSPQLDVLELTENFLNMEKKYEDKSSNSEKDTQVLTSDLNEAQTDDVVLASELNKAQTNEVDVESTGIPTKLTDDFLDYERFHTYYLSEDTPGFKVRTSEKESSSNVDVCGTVNLNKIVDELLDSLRHDIVEKGYDELKIPDIHETFVKKVSFFNVKGYFDAQQGWAKNLSTVYRTADVIASSEGKNLRVSCGFGLSDLEFGYDKYKASFLKIGIRGKLLVSISKNSVLLNATVSWSNGTCKVALDSLVLNKLGGFNLKITGLGPLNFLLTKIADWTFKKFHEEIRENVESTLKQEIEKLLKPFDCAQYVLAQLQ